jgi:hypothetical protein
MQKNNEQDRHSRLEEYRKILEDQIDIDYLYNVLEEECETWDIVGIVDVTHTIINGRDLYYTDDNDPTYYTFQTEDEDDIGVDHIYIHQNHYQEKPEFRGFMLYPLYNGRYVKIEYTC